MLTHAVLAFFMMACLTPAAAAPAVQDTYQQPPLPFVLGAPSGVPPLPTAAALPSEGLHGIIAQSSNQPPSPPPQATPEVQFTPIAPAAEHTQPVLPTMIYNHHQQTGGPQPTPVSAPQTLPIIPSAVHHEDIPHHQQPIVPQVAPVLASLPVLQPAEAESGRATAGERPHHNHSSTPHTSATSQTHPEIILQILPSGNASHESDQTYATGAADVQLEQQGALLAPSQHSYNYDVRVKTSDKFLAGTDANVQVGFQMKRGRGRPDKGFSLDKADYDDFERGDNDVYHISTHEVPYEDVEGICVGVSDSAGGGDAWHPEYIEVSFHSTTIKLNVNAWLEAESEYGYPTATCCGRPSAGQAACEVSHRQ